MNSRSPMVARSGEDLLAMLPVLFGFQPEQSFVLLGLGCDRPMHARVDLGGTRAEVVEALGLLFGPAHKNGVTAAVVLVLADLTLAERWRTEVAAAARRWGVELVAVVAADGGRWRPLGSGQEPREYDVWSHPFVARAVVEGRAVLPSRAALVESLAPSPVHVARVRDRLAAGCTGRLDGAEAVRVVAAHVDRGSVPGTEETAVLLASVRDPDVCLAVASATRREVARRHLDVWTPVVRASPEGSVAPAAALLGLAAWLAGEGALAWCAVDRATAAPQECPLVPVVARLLEGAVRPDVWDEWGGRAGCGPLSGDGRG